MQLSNEFLTKSNHIDHDTQIFFSHKFIESLHSKGRLYNIYNYIYDFLRR